MKNPSKNPQGQEQDSSLQVAAKPCHEAPGDWLIVVVGSSMVTGEWFKKAAEQMGHEWFVFG